jgi:hypothetical protein
MSAAMLIAACNAPVYNTPGDSGLVEIVTDHELLLTRATDEVLDQLVLLIRAREDGDEAFIEASFDEEQLEAFDEERDGDPYIDTIRRKLSVLLIKDALSVIFEQDPSGDPEEAPTLNSEVTYLIVNVGDQKRTLLITGGLSNGDEPTEAAPSIGLLDLLNLFDEPFVRPGTETAAQAEEPATALDSDALILLNDHLTAMLAMVGWNADTEDDFDDLNNLTHAVAEKQVGINTEIEAFILAHRQAAQPEE